MHTQTRHVIVTLVSLAALGSSMRAQHSPMPPGMTHQEHLDQIRKDVDLKKRGLIAMGFNQDTTTHHFRLYETGGAIEVAVNHAADETTLDQMRAHLKYIASEFGRGVFAKPYATHAEVPPGVRTMQERRTALTFQYEDMPAGGEFVSPPPTPKQRTPSTNS